MKLVIFGDGFTYPAKEGVSQHVMSQLFALTRHSTAIEPILILCDRGTMDINQIKQFPWKTVLVPHEVYYDYLAMRTILTHIKPDILQSYGVYHGRLISSRYSLEYKIPFVMEHHDVESELTDHLKLATNISASIYHDQIELCELASLNRTLSQHDYDLLSSVSPKRKNTFFNIPTIMDDIFDNIDISNKKATDVLFIGNGAYPPNKKAVNFIRDELAPHLPHINFHIIGRLSNDIKPASNIITYGMVDDIKRITDLTSIGLAPLESGSGLKLKVLTYLSAGLPVLGTPLAYRGYTSHSLLSVSSLEDFADSLNNMVANYDSSRALLARKLFLDTYSEEANIDTLISMYESLTYRPYITASNSRHIIRDDSKLPWLNEFREMPFSPTNSVQYINFASL
ncbi:MAG TPA: glycosyltransferase [Candidatus Saccharimonadales bacterium]